MAQTIGEIVERLIYIKDNYGIEDLGDLDAINNACNLLSHIFERTGTADQYLMRGGRPMKAIAISNGYTSGKVYVIWDIPHDGITGYEVFRDGTLIATSLPDAETPVVFENPTMFDHDHHTNLFKKDSTHKLMFVDDAVHQYQAYTYQVIATRVNDLNVPVEIIASDKVTIQVQ
jgi:hypothetical protein